MNVDLLYKNKKLIDLIILFGKDVKIMEKVNFISTNLNKYLSLENKDKNSLYFIEDAKKIYKGNIDITNDINTIQNFDDISDSDIVEGKFYININTFETRFKYNDSWVILNPGYISTKDGFIDDLNSNKISTVGATKEYIIDIINDITNNNSFINEIIYSDGKFTIVKNNIANNNIEMNIFSLNGMVKNPSYDSENLILTIPVIDNDDIVINLPKYKFIKSGQYYVDYPIDNPEYHNVIVLEIEDNDPIIIPAESLVGSYHGSSSDNIRVDINSNNEISASVIINPDNNNAITSSSSGLMVDLSNINEKIEEKISKLDSNANNHILIGSDTGELLDSQVSIKNSGELNDSENEIPTCKIISSEINKKEENLQNSIEAILSWKTL